MSHSEINKLDDLLIKYTKTVNGSKTLSKAQKEAKIRDFKAKYDRKVARVKKALQVECGGGCGVNQYSLAEGFVLWRDKTDYEANVNFKKLNEVFEEADEDLQKKLVPVLSAGINTIMKKATKAKEKADYALLKTLNFFGIGDVKKETKKWMSDLYENGRQSAAEETKTDLPPTPAKVKSQIKFDSEDIADIYKNEIEQEAKSFTGEVIATGAIATPAFQAALRNKLEDKAAKLIVNTQGNKSGQYINKGRTDVFDLPDLEIIAFQRSEILDSRTCNFCLSIDGRVLKADDPLARIGQVHTNCRGVNVPIFKGQELPRTIGYPKTITDNMDLVDGKFVSNNFKQLKKPVNKVSKDAQKEIKKRIENDSK